jgi:hypothetical protein
MKEQGILKAQFIDFGLLVSESFKNGPPPGTTFNAAIPFVFAVVMLIYEIPTFGTIIPKINRISP